MARRVDDPDAVHEAPRLRRQRVGQLAERDGRGQRLQPERLELACEAQDEVQQEAVLDGRRRPAADLLDEVGLVGRVGERVARRPPAGELRADRPVGVRTHAADDLVERDPVELDAMARRDRDGREQRRQVHDGEDAVAGGLVDDDLGHVGQRRRHVEVRSSEEARRRVGRRDGALVAGSSAVGRRRRQRIVDVGLLVGGAHADPDARPRVGGIDRQAVAEDVADRPPGR